MKNDSRKRKKYEIIYPSIINRFEDNNRIISEILMEEINQNLISVKMKIDLFEKENTGQNSKSIDFRKSKHLLDETINRLKKVSSFLYPLALRDLGLIKAIKILISEFEYQTGNRVITKLPLSNIRFRDELRLYQLIQEIFLTFNYISQKVIVDFEIIPLKTIIILRFSQRKIDEIMKFNFSRSISDKRFLIIKERINLLKGSIKREKILRNQDQLTIRIPVKYSGKLK